MDTTTNDRPHRRTALVAAELKRYCIDIAALQETRLPLEGSIKEEKEGYTFFWKGLREEDPRIHGVGLAIRNELLQGLAEMPVGHSERLMSLRIPLAKGNFATVICAYGPTLDSDEEIKDKFYDDLQTLFQRIPSTDKLVLLGDLNARVGTDHEVWEGILGRHGMGKMNRNGLRLLSFSAENGLAITNTMFQMKNIYKATWMHPRSRHWHQIDFVLVKKSDLKEVQYTRVKRGANCWTDHRLLVSKMNLTIRPKTRRRQGTIKRMNCPLLNLQEKQEELKHTLTQELEGIEIEPAPLTQEEVDSLWNRIITKIHNSALECLGTMKRRSKDWFDDSNDTIRQLLLDKNKAHDAYLSNPSSISTKKKWQEKRAETQRALRQLQNDWWMAKAREIQQYADDNRTHDFYDAIKCVYGPTRNPTTPVRSSDGNFLIKDKQGILDRWAEHFRDLLNTVNDTDFSIIDELPMFPQIPELDAPPSQAEIERAVKQLKNLKATGPDGVPAEIFKYGGPSITETLHDFYLTCWMSRKVPTNYRRANIVKIYKKKGDRAVCGNSRGLSLLDIAGKILSKVLLSRLLTHITNRVLPESQCGFRADRSTLDMIFVCRQLIEKCREQRQPFSAAFVDLTKAFDTVNRDLLYQILNRFGCPPTLVDIIRQLHDGTQARVMDGGEFSDYFPVQVGVKQGCVLAPVLFILFLVAVTHTYANNRRPEDGISIKYRTDGGLFNISRFSARTKTTLATIHELQYADDAAAVAHHPHQLQNQLTALTESYQRAGLLVNVRKTEVMFRPTEDPDQEAPGPMMVNGAELTKTDHFTYLGSIISHNGTIDREITNRICLASSAFGRLKDRVFLNHDLKLPTKIAVYKAVCMSTLLYGCETWTPYKRQIVEDLIP